jgi:alpha-tubulin suppressor-like RCC1 family protein
MARIIPFLAIVGLLGACTESTAPVRPAALVLSVTTPLAMFAGARDTITVTLIGSDGEPMTGVPIDWTSSDARIVQVHDGALVADSSGTARITAAVDTLAAWVDVTVHQSLATLELHPADTVLRIRHAVLLRLRARDGAGREMPLPAGTATFSSTNPSAVVVDTVGVASAQGWGSAVVTATLGGHVTTTRVDAEPAQLALGGIKLVRLDAGQAHLCGLVADGQAYCWGTNTSGETGQNPNDPTDPSVLVTVSDVLRFTTIDAGNAMTCGMTTNLYAWCWGSNRRGVLGQGPGSPLLSTSAPQRVTGDHQWQALAVGPDYTVCGITLQETVLCWGANDSLQVGRAPAAWSDSNVAPIAGSYTATAVDVDRYGGCAVSAGGTPICWGVLSPNADRLPAPLAGTPPLVAVSTGRRSACGIDADGTAYCWGRGSSRSLGHSTTNDAVVWRDPARVLGTLRFQKLAIADTVTCGLTTEGRIGCWGGPSPEDVAEFPWHFGPDNVPMLDVADSPGRMCALTAASRVYCW